MEHPVATSSMRCAKSRWRCSTSSIAISRSRAVLMLVLSKCCSPERHSYLQRDEFSLCTSKFVSDMASHAVGSPQRGFPVWGKCRCFRGLGPVATVSDMQSDADMLSTVAARRTHLTPSPDQKSGLSAFGIVASVPGNHWVFSAQTNSSHSTNGRPYVMVADQGVVKTPSSSTVNWSCKYLP